MVINALNYMYSFTGRILNASVSSLTILATPVLTCIVETNKPHTNVSIRWENDNGPVVIGAHNLTKLTQTLHQSILEVYQTQVYYCDAYIDGVWQDFDWYQIRIFNTSSK